MSPVIRLRHIDRFKDRHGKVRHYLRLPGRARVALPGEPGSPEFMAAYSAAIAAAPAPAEPRRIKPGSLDAVALLYYRSPAFTGLRASSQAVYRRITEELRAAHGDKPVALLEPRHIEALMAEKGQHKAAANHRLRVLRALAQVALDAGILRTDPTATVKRLRRETVGFQSWTEDHIAAFQTRWPSGTRPRLALALLLFTGQRRSDVVRMGRQSIRGGMLEVRQVKTSKRLEIPVHPELAAELAHVPDDAMLFLRREDGAAFTGNGFYMRFRAWCDDAGLPPGLSPHGLRKACGRRLAEAGATSHQIMSILGVTLAVAEVYTRAAEQRRMAVEGMAKITRLTGGEG